MRREAIPSASELTQHAGNTIKFLSDMFSARLDKLAAQKVGAAAPTISSKLLFYNGAAGIYTLLTP